MWNAGTDRPSTDDLPNLLRGSGSDLIAVTLMLSRHDPIQHGESESNGIAPACRHARLLTGKIRL